ncbi:MAG: hypothetical protein RLZZ387_4378 [Chloroflexota bacterium]|jgi:membrane protease YdiL (CAAX protease family)
MAQYDQQYTPSASPPALRPSRLAAVLLLDLLIVVAALLATALGLVALIVAFRVMQQGLSPGEVAGLSRADQLRLIGVDGILLVLIVQNIIFIGVPLVRTRLIRREPLASIGLQAPRPLRLTLIGLGLGVLLLVGNAVIGALFASAGIRQNQADQYPLFAGDYLGQALFMLGAAVIVPIGEEVLFRGYVFHTLRRMFADARWGLVGAYLLSSAVFGVAHSLAATEGVVALIIPTMLLGLALAWVVNRTGSLIPAIIAHAMNNGVALLALVTCINNPGMCPGL